MVNKSDGCWLWTGSTTTRGYGRFKERGRSVYAHRFAIEITSGRLRPGEQANHHCDITLCVRPTHLFRGNHKANMADMVKKGRAASGVRNVRHTRPDRTPRGVRHGRATLTDEDVRTIRALRVDGWTQQALADKFGTPQTNISQIVRRKAWRHVA